MRMTNWRVWSGWFGIAFIAIELVTFVLYATAGAPPALDDSAKLATYMTKNSSLVITFGVLSAVAVALSYVWLLGLRGVIRSAGEDAEWAGAFTFGVGLVSGALA